MFRGDRVRELRLQNKYTHEAFAKLLNITMRMVTRYETNEVDPAADVVARMADVFHVSADYLLGRTDDPTPCGQVSDLTPAEQEVLAALRRGDRLAAIRAIISEG
jgi:transcriptional regulator with XRE-family HTH domain